MKLLMQTNDHSLRLQTLKSFWTLPTKLKVKIGYFCAKMTI